MELKSCGYKGVVGWGYEAVDIIGLWDVVMRL